MTLDDFADSRDDEVYRLCPMSVYDAAIVGVVETDAGLSVVYDYEQVVQITMAEQGWSQREAQEWIDHNHAAGAGMPLFMVWRAV